MNDHVFNLADTQLHARADGSLWCPIGRILCVSDLHLGKSERIARRGGTLLPPYETRETLWRLEEAVAATDPSEVICLGDSFDDLAAAQSISDETRATLARLQAWRADISPYCKGVIAGRVGGRNLRPLSSKSRPSRHRTQTMFPIG